MVKSLNVRICIDIESFLPIRLHLSLIRFQIKAKGKSDVFSKNLNFYDKNLWKIPFQRSVSDEHTYISNLSYISSSNNVYSSHVVLQLIHFHLFVLFLCFLNLWKIRTVNLKFDHIWYLLVTIYKFSPSLPSSIPLSLSGFVSLCAINSNLEPACSDLRVHSIHIYTCLEYFYF